MKSKKKIFDLSIQNIADFNISETYLLLCATFFHDWGNVIDRKGHNKTTTSFYNEIFTAQDVNTPELIALSSIVRAHTGTSLSGDKDTLKDVPVTDFIHNEKVRLQLIAAILRFADELAECPDRTNISYIRTTEMPEESLCHNLHALFIQNTIDACQERIAVTYRIGIIKKEEKYSVSYPGTDKYISLDTFLDFLNGRIHKANMERRYTQYYMRKFALFQEMSISLVFIFMKDNNFSECRYTNEPIVLTDKILLSDKPNKLPFDPTTITKALAGVDHENHAQ